MRSRTGCRKASILHPDNTNSALRYFVQVISCIGLSLEVGQVHSDDTVEETFPICKTRCFQTLESPPAPGNLGRDHSRCQLQLLPRQRVAWQYLGALVESLSVCATIEICFLKCLTNSDC
jgi:hypothetical protein